MIEMLLKVLAFIEAHVNFITLLFAIIGGGFALKQWTTQIKHKRGEIVKELICKVRDDEDISSIMDVIDWDKGIVYNGLFSMSTKHRSAALEGISNDDLMKRIDKTLSHFSYICYLESNKTLTREDMSVFDYALRRITDNRHICNYLFSLYHWSQSLGVDCSFYYLISHALDKGYLDPDFKNPDSKKYKNMLIVARK